MLRKTNQIGIHAEKGKQNTHAAVVLEMSIAERKLYNLTSLKHSWEMDAETDLLLLGP